MGMLDVFLLPASSPVSVLGAVLVLLLVLLVSSSSFSSHKELREPPGPRPLPLLGNLLQLDLKRTYHSLLMLSKKYGSVFTVHLGPKKVVVLAGYQTVKEALVSYADEFGDREVPLIMQEHSYGHGVVWNNGEAWKEMRRFVLSKLRDYGMGKKACEDKIIEECQCLTEMLNEFKGEAFDPTQPLCSAVSNIICSMVYGTRFQYSDPEFKTLLRNSNAQFQLLASPSVQIYNIFPWLGKLFRSPKTIKNLMKDNMEYNRKMFEYLRQTLNPQMCRGFVDAFLVHQDQLERSEGSNNNSHFHDKNLMVSVMNLFNAGTETTATTLRWALLYLAKYPHIQEQVQEELSRVVGSRQVQVEDRKNLPFTDAVIHETQRLANIAPMSLPHRTSRDVTLQGHFIKKGTTVYPLLASVLNDESEWEEPQSFHPAHFLDKDGQFVKRDAFMPFSAGRRVCPGESLARMELFLFLTTLLQRFRFSAPPGVSEEELDLTPCVGLSLTPLPHQLCAVPCM